jgi:hypothetical protein
MHGCRRSRPRRFRYRATISYGTKLVAKKKIDLRRHRTVTSFSMNISKLRGNPRYFSARDLKLTRLTIEAVEVRKFNEQNRVVVQFVGEERELRLTPGQVSAMARAFGDDTDTWKGHSVSIESKAGKGITLTVEKPEPSPAS